MMSVNDAAEKLGVTGSRVRAMLKSGVLQGNKIGNTWAVSEESVARRLQDGTHPGRPKTTPNRTGERPLPDVETAHRIYDEAARTLTGCYDESFLGCARTPEEQAFWIRCADFFLQARQRELVDRGVY